MSAIEKFTVVSYVHIYSKTHRFRRQQFCRKGFSLKLSIKFFNSEIFGSLKVLLLKKSKNEYKMQDQRIWIWSNFLIPYPTKLCWTKFSSDKIFRHLQKILSLFCDKILSDKVQSILFSAGVLECTRFAKKFSLALQKLDRNEHGLRILLFK